MSEDWLKLRIESHGFRKADGPGIYRVAILRVGYLSIAPTEPSYPEPLDLVVSNILPFVGMSIRIGEEHLIVRAIEWRVDLDCVVAIVVPNPLKKNGLPRYFTDGHEIQL